MDEKESNLRQEIVRVMKICTQKRLIESNDGNISCRLDDNRLIITPSGIYKADLQPDDLIVMDMEGAVLQCEPGLRPTSETLLHLEAYHQRADISAVLHAHPLYATALTITGLPFPIDLISEVLLTLGDVPTAVYATPGTVDMALAIRALIRNHNTILLSHHGSLSVGKTLIDALIDLERLEHAAQSYALAANLGNIIPLPEGEIPRLREIYESFFKRNP